MPDFRILWHGPMIMATLSWVLGWVLGLPTNVSQAKDADRPTAAKTGTAAKSGNDRAFKAAKKEYQQRIHNKKPSERIAALKLLAEFPTGESADLVYVTLLDDKSDDVRSAAINFLAALRDRTEVTEKLLQRMTASSRKGGMDIRAVGALQALGGTEVEALQFRLIDYLNEFLGTPQADQQLLHAMLDEQAAKADVEVMRLLMLFTRTEFFDRHFGLRRCVVQGLTQIKDRDGITHLINLLPRFKGLVEFDVVSHLVVSTGQNFGDDAGKWKLWWREKQNQKQPDEKAKVPPIESYGKFGQYYGIPICAKRVVFVLDTSGSMRGGKIEAAQTELIRVIRELPKEVQFSVVAFDSSVRVWQHELVQASELTKQVAVNVVLEQSARGNTASYDALEAAFELNPEAIYFLSDGAPQGGKVDDPRQIIASISGSNRVRRVSIHSIGIDTNLPTATGFARFMKSLAEANWGVYKAVN